MSVPAPRLPRAPSVAPTALAQNLWSEVSARLGLDEPHALAPKPPIGLRRRRGYDARQEDGRAMVELVRDDESLLRWVYTPPAAAPSGGRRAYRAFQVGDQNVVQRFRFAGLGSNAVTTKLLALDAWLTPGQGMKRLRDGQWIDDPAPAVDSGRVLLLVHGTFSQSAMWTDELQSTDPGRQLLADWQSKYSAILAFNHATLSVGAWSNAIDLNRALRAVRAPIDVVSHSRGGLVVSWLLRMDPVPVERVVFVGSPLVGTSLAAPDRLRAALDLLANYADVVTQLGNATSLVFPLAAGVAGLAKALGAILHLGSGLPLLDAAIALVPGLATQQHVANNLDLRQLFADDWTTHPDMLGIGASFQPDESREPLWKFWRRFTNIGGQVKAAAADLVFSGPNDLVVDLDSMYRLGETADLPFQDLGTGPTTHHTNYFRDARVLEIIGQKFK